MNAQQASKALKILGVLFLVHAILVSTHEGEFWPFSIYPMFSQAGNPWARAMVLDVTDLEESELWVEHVYPLRSDEMVVSLRALGVTRSIIQTLWFVQPTGQNPGNVHCIP